MVTTIEDCGFFESIPLWAVTLIGGLFITVLSFILIMTVYGRFFKLYMYTALAPIPMGVLNLYACIGYPQAEDEYLTKNSAQFHEHLGFTLAGTFHNCGYKFGRWYDMIWMEKVIGEHRPDQPDIVPYQY